ncbi:MAG: hypothetical protein FIB02_02100 [Desulfuromonas sp.]|nr:hypothetical protein [Desulfuromonas sp.]
MTMVAKPASITVPVSDADGVFTVNWGISVTASITYVLEEAVDPLFKAGLRVVYCGTALSTEIAGRIQNRTYYYRVKAIKPGLIDSVWRVAGQGCAVPGTTRVISPAGIEVPVADTDGSYTVNWAATATAGATYVLEEATNPVFNASLQIVYSGAALSKSITGRVQNQTYYYRVKAIKPGVKDSNWLVATNGCAVPGSVAVVAPATLAVPANDVNGTYVVSWDASSTPSVSYRLEEATNDTFTQELRTVYFGAEKAAVITGRTFGKTYYYRVRAQRPGYRDSNWRQAAMGVAIVLPPGPAATDYFPNATGDTWFYTLLEMEDGGVPVTDLSRLSVAGTRIVLGQVASVFQERAHSDNRLIEYYFSKDQSGVMNLGNNDPEDTLSPQLIPYRELVFPLQVGLITQFTKSGLDYGSDLDGDTLNERINLTLQSSITGVEPVQVPAGSFPNAGKRLTVIDGEVILSYSGFTIPFSGSDETWSVAGTGVVKQTSTTTADTISITSMAEVRGYIVGGIGRGMGWPATIAGSLSPGDGYGPVPVGNPVVASDGTNYLIMVRKATRLASEWRAQWVGILVDPDGVVIKTFNVTSPTRIYDSESGMKAAVAFDGNSYLFVYEQDNNFASSGLRPSLTGVRLSPAGMLIGSSVAVAPSGSDSPALAFDGTNFLLTYRYRHQISGLYQIYGALVSSTTGQVTGAGGVPFTSAPGYQEDPVVAFDGTNYLVVWDQGLWEAQGQTPGIYAVRITPEGTVLDPGSFVVFDNNIQSVPTKSSNPAIAFDGNNYLVAYEYSPENLNTQLAATRITKEGQLLDGTPITGGFSITTNHNGFAGDVTLTFSGNEYWAAWASSPGIGIYDGIFGARIGTDGTVKSPGSNGMRMGPKTQSYYPAITANSSGGYLVWLNSFSNSVPCEAIGMSIYPFEP